MSQPNDVEVIKNNIARFEKQYNLSIPSAYKDALLRGELNRYRHWKFEFIGADGFKNSTNIDNFFAFDEGIESVPVVYQSYVGDDRLAPFAIPIARCIAGNLICFDSRVERLGKIYYWDHELEPLVKATDNLAVLASDLPTFLAMLQPD